MKLLLKFSGFGSFETELVVDWEKSVKEFPPFCKYGGKYWGAQFYDKDTSGKADQVLLLSEYKETALPVDMGGNPFPVTDLALMFGLAAQADKPCWCGLDSYGGGGNHSSYCPKGQP